MGLSRTLTRNAAHARTHARHPPPTGRYCNNMDEFGFTDGSPRPGGFLSNLDSQQLLTWDNMTGPGAWK